MSYQYKDAQEYIEAVWIRWPAKKIAKYLGVHNAHIYRALVGDITPTLARAVAAKGFAPPPPPRCRVRWAPDCTPELRDWLNAEADRRGVSHSQMLELLVEAYKENRKYVS